MVFKELFEELRSKKGLEYEVQNVEDFIHTFKLKVVEDLGIDAKWEPTNVAVAQNGLHLVAGSTQKYVKIPHCSVVPYQKHWNSFRISKWTQRFRESSCLIKNQSSHVLWTGQDAVVAVVICFWKPALVVSGLRVSVNANPYQFKTDFTKDAEVMDEGSGTGQRTSECSDVQSAENGYHDRIR